MAQTKAIIPDIIKERLFAEILEDQDRNSFIRKLMPRQLTEEEIKIMSKREYLDTSYLDVEGDKITAHSNSNSHSHEITPPGVTSTYTISIGDLKEEDLLKLTSSAGENLIVTGDDWENVTTTMNMSQVDFEAFGRYIAGAEDLGLNPFWKTEEFKDTEFQIVDNQLEMKPSASGVGAEASAFFVDVLKPMVDMYLSRNPTEDTWPNGDGVTDDNYDRAMSYLR